MEISQRIELVTPGELKPYERNARTHSEAQVDQIAKSIREFGFVNPVLAGADGEVIAGHGRLLAAKKIGMPHVPVIRISHLTEAQRRALVLADNRIAEDARWDYQMLALELGELDVLGFDLEATGFTDAELGNLLPDLEVEADKILSRNTEQSAAAHDSSYGVSNPPAMPGTQELKKEVVGAKELTADQFDKFEHKCPRCNFEFN